MRDLKDAGDLRREAGDVAGYVPPVDPGLCGARPEVLIAAAAVVMQVELGDAWAQKLKGSIDAGAGILVVGEVSVADIKCDPYGVKVADTQDLKQSLGGSDFVLQGLKQKLHAKRAGKSFQVLDCGERVLKRARAPRIALHTEMQSDRAKGDLLG